MLAAYAELACRSNFSFLTGASHPEELVARAKALRYAALAITDECSLAGVVRAHTEAVRLGLPLVVGAQMRLAPPGAASAPGPAPLREPAPAPGPAPGPGPASASAPAPAIAPAPGARLTLLAMSRRGYGNLSQWITLARRRASKGGYLAHASDLEGRVPHLPVLAGLPDCLALLHADAALLQGGTPFETLLAQALWLKTWFGGGADRPGGRAALALARHLGPHDALLADAAQQVAALTGLPIVAVGDVLMHARSRKPLQDALTATRLGCTVAEAGFALEPNAEAHLRSRARLAQLFRPEWMEASVALAARCAFSLAELRYEYPREIVPDGHTPASWLRHLTEEGAARRFAHLPGGTPAAVRATLEHELALIAQLQYEPYFLTVADLVAWARGQGILCQGRGSAANSAVCYCLGVTEVDPSRMSLLFERFVSAERNEPPDIDVDFEHQRREEVIQYVYRRYGRHRAALTAVVISYRPRSALRDMGRALGIDLDRIDAVAKGQHWFDGRSVQPERLAEHGFDPGSPLCRLWIELTGQLIGFPRHLSQHPGGFVIARDDLAQLVPVENAAMEGRSVIQWDKDDLDALGLLKVDLLALGMLSAIRRALDFVALKQHGPAPGRGFRMQDVPAEDPATYEMLCRGDSVGTFQVESRAQMSMLPRLQPRSFYDLVIEVAIVRPGPIQGGMVHPYLRRRSGEEPVEYPSDEVRRALERTLGVPIFQEQVMQLAILAADFTPGEADQLRRAMAAWKRKGGLGPFHERLVGRMVAKGYSREYAERIFRQIEGFGEYGFPESHAASFALLVYVSAWLKCHHPDAFLAALLNSQPMGFYAPAQLVRDAREHGVEVRPVCVLRSQAQTTLESDAGAAAAKAADAACREAGAVPGLLPVRLGFDRIAGLPAEVAARIVAARAQRPFDGTEDLARRAQLDARALALLAQADALAPLTGHRHQAAWSVAGIDTRATAMLARTRTHEAAAELAAPGAAATVLADYRSLGLSLAQHPVALLRDELAAFKVQPAAVLRGYPAGRLARASGLVTHRQRPETARGVVFVTLEDETGAVNVIVWPQVAEAQRRALLASTLLTVYGVWQSEGAPGREVRHLVARRLVDHSALLHGLAARSRDFR
ncbi:MAG: error-prone DNA polymerase [Rubrivivax sp.]|jgi:error-prone DNA polymerase|nr:error-prone DNA polymerase [Rubrivivax sp.]MCA3257478.1 error-prone DNA polymerase [Rubrivivax sp.]MCZ8029854.1 error-prone DNA polymerase [Rubrivivax sp.]